MVVLSGEPGIGKTRLTEVFCQYAETEGAEVLVGRCYEGSGAPPFWPWSQALRSYAARREVATLHEELGGAAVDVATIDPDLRLRLELAAPPIVEPEQARFRVFDGVTRTLVRASTVRPIVIVLEDLHGADKPSLLLLQFLARTLHEARVLVVATLRDVGVSAAHPVSETLSELARERVSETLGLGGLALGDVGALLAHIAHAPVAPEVAAVVHARTGGNPLYASEIARALLTVKAPEGPGPRPCARTRRAEDGASGDRAAPRTALAALPRSSDPRRALRAGVSAPHPRLGERLRGRRDPDAPGRSPRDRNGGASGGGA